MKLEITEEEREFLLRIVERAIKFFEMGLLNKNMIADFIEDKQKAEILRGKLKKDEQ